MVGEYILFQTLASSTLFVNAVLESGKLRIIYLGGYVYIYELPIKRKKKDELPLVQLR